MAGDILIVDCVATNRIVLKVKLLTAQYRVRPCSSLDEARAEIAASPPDLMLVDVTTNADQAHDFFADLKSDPDTAMIPIIATGGFATPRDRVNALKAGANDVISKPFDDQILQARIRSLLRGRDAKQELRMREGTRAALGFAEACNDFTAPAQIVAVAPDESTSPQLTRALDTLDNVLLESAPLDHMIGGHNRTRSADLFVIDFRPVNSDENDLFRVLSELRSRSTTRHASILVLLPQFSERAAAMALDLGANDVLCAHLDPDEIAHRCTVLITAKSEADALRQTVESGLEAAITDPLTGLFNRRYALPHLTRLSNESRKTGRQFAIMVLDLDHFKSINDTYGHKAGDEILKQVANRLRDNLRAVDLLARIGGEEFLVAIPKSDAVHARTAAERLCKLIGDTPFFIGRDGHTVSMTMSVGVSLSNGEYAYDVPGELDDLVNAADTALYAAKNGGRNKVSLSAA